MIQRFFEAASGFERSFAALGSTLGVFWSFAFGPTVGPLLWWLVIFVVIDFVTGWFAAVRTHTFKTRILREGVLRKLLMFVVCGLSHGLDVVFEPVLGVNIFQSMTICAYALGEFASILENFERAGFGSSIPPILRRLIGAVNHRLESSVDQIEGVHQEGVHHDKGR